MKDLSWMGVAGIVNERTAKWRLERAERGHCSGRKKANQMFFPAGRKGQLQRGASDAVASEALGVVAE